jgi:hypothetical protein
VTRTLKPTKLENPPDLPMIDEKDFETDFSSRLNQYVIKEKRTDATKTLKEIIQNAQKVKVCLSKQAIVQSTTPASVNLLVKNLIEALTPFVDTSYGVDQDSYDQLTEEAQSLLLKANKIYEYHSNLRLNNGIEYEQSMALQPYLKGYFEIFCPNINEKVRDDWICSIFDFIDLKYISPDRDLNTFRTRYYYGPASKE